MMEVILILKFRQKLIKRLVFSVEFKGLLAVASESPGGRLCFNSYWTGISFLQLPRYQRCSSSSPSSSSLSIDIAIILHRAWTRYWARGRWNLFLPSWIASPHQHHSACAQRYQIATLSTWQTNKTSTAPKKTSSPLRQNDKKQNQKTPTKQKSQKQKVSSYNCKAKKQQQLAHEQRKTT